MLSTARACAGAALGAVVALLLALLPPAPVLSGAEGAPAAAAGCEASAPAPGEARLPVEQQALLAVARELPLDVKLGQLLIVGFVGTAPDAGLVERAARGRLGGLFLLGRNVRDAAQTQALNARVSEAAAGASLGIRPFLATDFEGGTVNALRAITGTTPSAAALAAGGLAAVQAQGAADAAVLKSLGFNANLAPVVDVLSEPSAVIGTRAFSSDPGAAAALGRAYLRGLQEGGVLGVLKHFPGHGATSGDSHVLLPVVERSLAQLEAADLVPYRQAIAAGEAQAVMVGHLLVPALDPEIPASLSRPIIAGLLRDRLAFDGLVVTDELKMGAVSRRFSVTEAAVLAIQAGVDVVLADYTGAEQDAVLQALTRACLAGQFPAERLERSVARVLRLKRAYDLLGPELSGRYEAHVARLSGIRGAASAPPAPPPAAPPDFGGQAIAGLPGGASGRFYVAAAGGGEFGYALADEGGAALWSAYAAMGGPARLGYPISQRFEFAGRTAQLTQRALLQWDSEQNAALLANAFELFERAGTLLGWAGCATPAPSGEAVRSDGTRPDDVRPECSLDSWLEQKGIPPAVADDGSHGVFRRAVAARLSWLEHEAIRAAYLADPAGGRSAPWPGAQALAAGLEGVADDAIPWPAIERHGLPMSRPVRYGPFVAQRFQRVVLQLWVDEVPGMPPPGAVTPVLAGELLREAGFVPLDALIPTTLAGEPGPLPALPPAPQPPEPPAAPAAPAAPPATATPASAQPTPTPPATPSPTATPQPTRPPSAPTAAPPTAAAAIAPATPIATPTATAAPRAPATPTTTAVLRAPATPAASATATRAA
jgi:beta-N-acetylhexosaminidase